MLPLELRFMGNFAVLKTILMNTDVLENLELSTEELLQQGIAKGTSYQDYRVLMDNLAAEGIWSIIRF